MKQIKSLYRRLLLPLLGGLALTAYCSLLVDQQKASADAAEIWDTMVRAALGEKPRAAPAAIPTPLAG